MKSGKMMTPKAPKADNTASQSVDAERHELLKQLNELQLDVQRKHQLDAERLEMISSSSKAMAKRLREAREKTTMFVNHIEQTSSDFQNDTLMKQVKTMKADRLSDVASIVAGSSSVGLVAAALLPDIPIIPIISLLAGLAGVLILASKKEAKHGHDI